MSNATGGEAVATVGRTAEEGARAAAPDAKGEAASAPAGLAALCMLARLHRVAAEPAALMHQLGKTPSEPWSPNDLLLAARYLGLKGKLSRTSPDRLSLSPLPALALLRDGRIVVLAQCDGQRVLLQDPSGQMQGSRPVIEPLVAFAEQWTGELILVTSRASVAGELAKFDFSWFIPSLVKYRKLLGEVLLVSLFLQLFALISPLFFQVVMDKVLVHNGLTTLDVLVIGLLVVVVFESGLTALRTYVIDESGDVVVELASGGTDSIETSVSFVLLAEMENLTLTGGASINGVGNSLANALIGNVGSNRLDGGGGADSMTGGAGDDTYVVSDAADSVSEAAGAGVDSIESSLSWVLGSNIENLTLVGALAISGTGNTLSNRLTGNGADNVLNGGGGADTLVGGAGNDGYVVDNTADVVTELASEGTDGVSSSITYTISANVENLTLTGASAVNGTGNALDNVLTGNSAANVLAGGAGNDTYFVGTGDTVTESASAGTDTVSSSITWTLGSNLENLMLTGSTAINGTGNTLVNVLTGNGAANTLDGSSGADTLIGGAGSDSYVVDNTADVVTELANEGTDLVSSTVTYTLAANVENLTLTGSTAINGTGNALDNVLTGNSAANVLTGGAGNDTYVVGTGDTVTEAASAGTDTVSSSIAWTLGSNLENLTLTGTSAVNGTGNALDNVLTGNSAANVLTGGSGNDTYVVGTGDTVTEAASAGTDTVQSSITWTLGSNLENLTLTGTSAINGTGNTLANVLTGNAAANTLDGGGGADTLVGGAGNDSYVVDNTADVVTELTAGGTDGVSSSVTYTLSANVENLTLTGSTVINGTGNASDNVLTGNSAANVLSGGAGNDTYVVGTGDTVTEAASAGTDTVSSSIAWTLGNNLENLTLTGSSAINGTGNTLNNVLTGNAANNTLTGNAGNDTLDGGAGTDTLVGGTGNDSYVLGRGYGADTVQENDATAGNTDVLQFLSGVASDQIWLRQVSNNLEVSIIGTSDKATLTNWYLGNQYHVEQFKTSDGKTLLDSQVQNLVSAMAGFTPPAAGQTTLPPNYQTALAPVIAANWNG